MEGFDRLDRERLQTIDDAQRLPSAGARPTAASRLSGKRIVLRAPAVVRRYVQSIAGALEKCGHRVRVESVPASPTPNIVDWLLFFERIAYRAKGASFSHAAPKAPAFDGDHDLAIDLAGTAQDDAGPTLRLVYPLGDGEAGLLQSVLSGEAPMLDIVATQAGKPERRLRHACLAIERTDVFAAALDGVTARLATIIAGVIGDIDGPGVASVNPHLADRPADKAAATSPLAFGANTLAQKLMDRVVRLVRRPGEWQIAVRPVDGAGVMERGDWSGAPWQVVSDDGQRYFADPFLFAHAGQRWLFCEEYPYATAKGILSVATVASDGSVGAPRPFLETGSHLSWPNIFAHGEDIFMIPESAGEGRVELWRSIEMPHRWALDRVLIDDVRAHDPVLHVTPGGAFILATLDDDGGSSWDALGLFHAPDLFGQWRAHPTNPLLVDASSARAAGPLIRREDGLWRAVQDCRAGYGAGLALCRVTQLDEAGFAQEVMTRLDAPVEVGATGVHTLSRLGDLEAIDLFGARASTKPA